MNKNNTGEFNTGGWNTGNYNTGNFNTGDRNTRYCNTGNCNTGNRNAGNCNTGNCNAGGWNTGNYNTGHFNTGGWNTGYCNSVTPEDCLIFNKPAKRKDWLEAEKPKWMFVSLTKWVSEEEMSDKEKTAHPSYITTGGYLKAYSSLQDAYKDSWEETSQEDRELTFKLPNYDRNVFIKVFGFDPEADKQTCSGKVVVIDGKKYKLQEIIDLTQG